MNNNETYNSFFARHYDLLYTGKKDYKSESLLIEKLFKDHGLKHGDSILDVGCGTGEHAIALAKMGYRVKGVDISLHMIKEASKKIGVIGGNNIEFECCETKLLKCSFSYVYSMFNVVNCLTDFEALVDFFKQIKGKLRSPGIYLFDSWNSGAAFLDNPKYKEEKIHSSNGTVFKRVTPKLDPLRNTCYLNYELEINTKGVLSKRNVVHRIKFFLREEMLAAFKEVDFVVVESFNNLKDRAPVSSSDWTLTYVVKSF